MPPQNNPDRIRIVFDDRRLVDNVTDTMGKGKLSEYWGFIAQTPRKHRKSNILSQTGTFQIEQNSSLHQLNSQDAFRQNSGGFRPG